MTGYASASPSPTTEYIGTFPWGHHDMRLALVVPLRHGTRPADCMWRHHHHPARVVQASLSRSIVCAGSSSQGGPAACHI